MKKRCLFLLITLSAAPYIGLANNDVVQTAKSEGCMVFYNTVTSSKHLLENAKKKEGESGSLAPFTVFVPNDAVFGDMDAAKKKKCITFHVVPGKKLETLDKVKTEMKTGVTTVGEKLLFCVDDKIFLDESPVKATIIKGPLTATNGVVYIIDKVLLPADETATPQPTTPAPATPAPATLAPATPAAATTPPNKG